MTTTKLLSPVDGRVSAERLSLTRFAGAVADARAAQKLLATGPLADRIAPVKARVSKRIENIPVLPCLGFHAVTQVKSCHLKKVTP